MKLSDVKGERTIEVIANLIEPIANIYADKSAADLFERKKVLEGMDAKSFVISRAKIAVPALLNGHKSDIISILATIEGVEEKEYADSMNLMKLMKDLVELLTDEAFMGLFTSAQSEESFGSAPESTADQKT